MVNFSVTASVTKIITTFFGLKVAFIAMSDLEFQSLAASVKKVIPTFLGFKVAFIAISH